MKRSHLYTVLLSLVILSLSLWGCGSGPGQPGSSGSEDTGVKLEATVTPLYLGENTSSVDVIQSICDIGPPPEFESFTDHQATLTVLASLLNPNNQIPPGTLFIENYTVQFRRSNDSIGAPPIESDTRFKSIVIVPPISGTSATSTTDTVILVDLKRKEKYRQDMLTGQYTSGLALINNYTATYTFTGKNQYGEGFSFIVQHDFQIGSFDYCD